MPEDINKAYVDINKAYVAKYINQAQAANNQEERNNALYRAGTQMEVIPCNGNDHLTSEQQQTVLAAAEQILGSGDG